MSWIKKSDLSVPGTVLECRGVGGSDGNRLECVADGINQIYREERARSRVRGEGVSNVIINIIDGPVREGRGNVGGVNVSAANAGVESYAVRNAAWKC